MEPRDIIIKPIITEKAMLGMAMRKYTFRVDKRANKVEIAEAVNEIFGVEVDKVRTLNVRGRKRRRKGVIGFTPSWKKAIVKLKEGSKGIEFFEGMV